MGLTTGGYMLGNLAAARAAEDRPLTDMMLLGRLVACGGLVAGLAALPLGLAKNGTALAAAVAAGVGNGLTAPNANAGALSVAPHLAGSAAGLSGAMIVGFGAAFSSLTGAVATPENGYGAVLGLMLLCAALGLLAALDVRRLDRSVAPEDGVR